MKRLPRKFPAARQQGAPGSPRGRGSRVEAWLRPGISSFGVVWLLGLALLALPPLARAQAVEDEHAGHAGHAGHEAAAETTAADEPARAEDPYRFKGIDVVTVLGQAPDHGSEEWVDLRVEKRPSGDGADLLGRLPGFSLIRQGGAGSDPLFRGLGGSRLNVLVDGVPYAGACNHAMDPATAYVNPGEFSDLVVLQGPQSVRNAGTISGTVDFQRSPVRFEEPGARAFGSGVLGSFGQNEFAGDVALGMRHGYLRASGGYAESDDYVDGDGNAVFSRYDRWNSRLALGWTPGPYSLLEASAERSDGRMANATIHMDSTKLDRRAYGLRFEKSQLGLGWLERIELRANRIEVDHEMDDFTLRPVKTPAQSNPVQTLVMGQGWLEYSGKGAVTLAPTTGIDLELGIDFRSSDYDARAASGIELFLFTPPDVYTSIYEQEVDISSVPRNEILDFTDLGAYAELSTRFREGSRGIAGLRYDNLRTDTGTMHAAGEISSVVLSGSNRSRNQGLWAAFLRYEQRLQHVPLLFATGIGHAQRGADYWEVYSYDGFALAPEKNTEIDVYALYGGEKLGASLSFFLSHVDDFILTYNGVSAYNVEAERVGGEGSLSYRILPELVASAEIAMVYAENRSDGVPLAQTPPLEGTLRLAYERDLYSLGVSSRFVDSQERIHADHGNRLAVDTKPTPGFAVLAAEAAFTPWPWANLSFGVENILDHTYHEHLTRTPSPVPGFVVRDNVKEPGRRFWLRLNLEYDI